MLIAQSLSCETGALDFARLLRPLVTSLSLVWTGCAVGESPELSFRRFGAVVTVDEDNLAVE